ncbi:MAG TPA: DivIVA domain-containing protein [Rubricoccaceae bacterium]
MKLNPLDIRRQQFARKTFGGYDTDEVDGFLKQLADQWEGALDEIRVATERTQEAENKLRHYERVEMALQEALETTRETGRRAEAMAEQKARLILDQAEMRARQIVQDAERDRHGLRQDLVKLTARQTEIGARLRGFLLSELEILAQFQGDDPIGFIKLQPASSGNASSGEVRAVEAAPEVPRLAETAEERPDEPEPPAAASWQSPVAEPPPTSEAHAPERAPADSDMPSAPPADATQAPMDGATPNEARPPAEAAPPPAPSWFEDPTSPDVPDPAAPAWDLRSLVAGPDDNVAGSEAERERIRRILDDLD